MNRSMQTTVPNALLGAGPTPLVTHTEAGGRHELHVEHEGRQLLRCDRARQRHAAADQQRQHLRCQRARQSERQATMTVRNFPPLSVLKLQLT